MANSTLTPRYLIVWGCLLALMAMSLLAGVIPVGRGAIVTLILAIAAVKAALVARHFMHLTLEPWLIYAIATVPILLVVGLMLTLFPDFVLGR